MPERAARAARAVVRAARVVVRAARAGWEVRAMPERAARTARAVVWAARAARGGRRGAVVRAARAMPERRAAARCVLGPAVPTPSPWHLRVWRCQEKGSLQKKVEVLR